MLEGMYLLPIKVGKTYVSSFQINLSWCDQDIHGEGTSFVNLQDRHSLLAVASLTICCTDKMKRCNLQGS